MPVACEAGLKLNLGCGQDRIEGWVGVDRLKTGAVDVIHDLETFPWPFDDNSASHAVMVHVLEHISDSIGFMHELYRVMQPGGTVIVVGPHAQSSGCWQDPTHKRAINEKFFMYFSKKFRESDGMKVDFYPITCDFEMEGDILYDLEPEFKEKTNEEKTYAIKHLNNVIRQFRVILRCIK